MPDLCLTSMPDQHGASGMGHQAWGIRHGARPTWHALLGTYSLVASLLTTHYAPTISSTVATLISA